MMRHLLTHLRTPALVAVIVVMLDQITKALVLRTWPLPQTGEISIIGQWLTLTYIRNDGVAFGIFQGIPQFFTVTSLLIMAGAIYYYLHHLPEHNRWSALMLGLIIGGALGNVIDRVHAAKVTDFIQVFLGSYPFPVFNVADSAISVGAVALIVFSLFSGPDKPTVR